MWSAHCSQKIHRTITIWLKRQPTNVTMVQVYAPTTEADIDHGHFSDRQWTYHYYVCLCFNLSATWHCRLPVFCNWLQWILILHFYVVVFFFNIFLSLNIVSLYCKLFFYAVWSVFCVVLTVLSLLSISYLILKCPNCDL